MYVSPVLVVFLAAFVFVTQAKAPTDAEIEAAFKAHAGADNVLTLNEFTEWCTAKDVADAAGIFRRFDKNGDGNVTLEEFKKKIQEKDNDDAAELKLFQE